MMQRPSLSLRSKNYRCASLWRRMAKNRDGATAIEFALVAPLFLAMMFSLFEVGWFFYVNSIIDASAAEAGRLIETGRIQKSSGTDAQKEQMVFDAVCDILGNFGNCDARLTVDVSSFTSFAALAADTSTATCATAPPADVDAIPFSPGEELDIIRVRLCFLYSPINPAIGVNFTDEGSNQRALVSQIIFQNEPYETG